MPLNPGDSLGRFTIDSCIGVGGMGEVYLASDPSLERRVAIKILGIDVSGSPDGLARFVREAKAASALNHPNILTIYEITESDGTNFIVSEYVEGRTLKSRMKDGRMPLAAAPDIAVQTASALAAAHEAGIVHRDIKPANIMVRSDGIVKVVDFGIAKLTQRGFDRDAQGEAPTLSNIGTTPGILIGTPKYMSPEQARGKPVDQRSDIFSLGLVLFELFADRPAFDGESPLDVVSAILKDPVPNPGEIVPGLPEGIDRVVEKCLRKDRDQRYQNVKDLLIDLTDIRDDLRFREKRLLGDETVAVEGVHVTESDPAAETGSLTANLVNRRRFTVVHVIALVALLLIPVAGYIWYESYTHEATSIAENAVTTELASWSSAPGELFSVARFSPDGKLIAFSSTRSGTKDIWVMQANSTEAIQITKDEFANTDPIWSPDGSEIAYFSDRGTGGDAVDTRTGVWRISALGGTPRSVGPIKDGSSELRRWTSRGRIVYQSGGELYSMDPANGSTEKLTNPGSEGGTVSWADVSDDESRVSYVIKVGDNRWKLMGRNLSASEPSEIYSTASSISDVVWLPASDRYFISAEFEGTEQVFLFKPGEDEAEQITRNPTGSVVVDASPDGASVLFTSVREESDIWSVQTGSGNESPVARGIDSELWPSVSPDGEKIAFHSVRNLDRGNKLLASSLLVRPNTPGSPEGDPIEIAKDAALPRWSPDGSTLAFLRIRENGNSVWVVNASGGEERKIADGAQAVAYSVSPYNRVHTSDLAWLSDSSGLIYSHKETSGASVRIARLTGGTAEPVSPPADNESQYCPILSPDGKRLAFFSQRNEGGEVVRSIWATEDDLKEPRKIFETERLIRLIGWDKGGEELILAEASKFSSIPEETSLLRLRISGGDPEQFVRLQNAYYYNIFPSPDNESIAYAARKDGKDDIWIVAIRGGEFRKLTANNDSETYFSALSWSPDSGTIYFGKQTRFSLLSKITGLKE
ncbi:MAG TPA: protein kinase [Aridibacter sp.]|nr:protein kinase [Aridibacter sp.]